MYMVKVRSVDSPVLMEAIAIVAAIILTGFGIKIAHTIAMHSRVNRAVWNVWSSYCFIGEICGCTIDFLCQKGEHIHCTLTSRYIVD